MTAVLAPQGGAPPLKNCSSSYCLWPMMLKRKRAMPLLLTMTSGSTSCCASCASAIAVLALPHVSHVALRLGSLQKHPLPSRSYKACVPLPPTHVARLSCSHSDAGQVRDLKRRSAAAAAPAPAADADNDVPYIETLTQIFEAVASVFLQHEQLALFIGGTATAAATLHSAQDAAVQQQLQVLDAFIEDFKIAKRANTLRSKQVLQ